MARTSRPLRPPPDDGGWAGRGRARRGAGGGTRRAGSHPAEAGSAPPGGGTGSPRGVPAGPGAAAHDSPEGGPAARRGAGGYPSSGLAARRWRPPRPGVVHTPRRSRPRGAFLVPHVAQSTAVIMDHAMRGGGGGTPPSVTDVSGWPHTVARRPGLSLHVGGGPLHRPLHSAVMAPYGSWSTPVTSELVVRAAAGLGGVTVHGDTVTWSEQRPEEGGRTQLVQRVGDGPAVDLLPAGFNARTAAHEYGGGAWWVAGPHGVVRQLGGPAPVPADRQGDAGAGHGRARGPPRATGGPTGASTPAGGGCWSCVSTIPWAAARPRWSTRSWCSTPTGELAPVARDGPRLRVRPPDLARRRPAVLAAVVAPRHALGRHRAVRGRPAGDRGRPALAHPQVVAGRPDAAPAASGTASR